MKKIFMLLFFLLMFGPQFAHASGNQLIIINKASNELAFYEKGELVKTFPVGTGRTEGLTPEGTFPIVNKIKNRPYYTGGIPGGDPKNPLGNRWLGLEVLGTYGTTYAIHGNNNPDSIGKYVSAGCVRMHNEDIRWLFDRVELYTKVSIVNSKKSFDEIAKANGYQLKPPVKVLVSGKELKLDVNPVIENNRVLIPMRTIFDELGAAVQWEHTSKTIVATKNNQSIKLKIHSTQATKNGQFITLDTAPTIRQNTTFVPVRFVSEALGVEVKWDSNKRIVYLGK
ncbi:L,D-transpeptidase family protein [Cytobacillus depressus]|uniref:L,D-transpeptidase family protein n=1 Tax=Cytobacillus depressus TaxID=1602942 RepID=A0A6L3V8K8_9BACI|nr:stalk domain-containing protein [Cytobacillus depressus]KAB2336685.1 L,D-transpeptidase family protein [Cytobacillus depressus]